MPSLLSPKSIKHFSLNYQRRGQFSSIAQMHALRRRLPQLISISSSHCYPKTLTTFIGRAASQLLTKTDSTKKWLPLSILAAPWSATQHRGVKVLGTDVRSGNVIQRKGRMYQVLKTQHTQQGRGGAHIQVELRDVDSGNKVTERFRTDEALERVFVQEKHFTFLYAEGDSVTIMDPDTFEQMEVSKDLFGKAVGYLKDDLKVILQLYDGKIMSASVPTRVTCTVVEAPSHNKSLHATPQYKRVLLDNGLSVLAPPFIATGDEIIINTTDDSYITRAKE